MNRPYRMERPMDREELNERINEMMKERKLKDHIEMLEYHKKRDKAMQELRDKINSFPSKEEQIRIYQAQIAELQDKIKRLQSGR